MMVYISLLLSVSHRSVDCSDPETPAADSGGQVLLGLGVSGFLSNLKPRL